MVNKSKLLFLPLFFLFFCGDYAEAKKRFLNLADLVGYSDLVAQGSLVLDECKEHCIFQFRATKIFKGRLSKNEPIMVCSFPYPDPQFDEWVDMTQFRKEIIIFSKKEGECYRPFGLQETVIRTVTYSDGTISTSGIRDEPRRQKLKDFQEKIEKEVKKTQAEKSI
jgi:hypothetical protein